MMVKSPKPMPGANFFVLSHLVRESDGWRQEAIEPGAVYQHQLSMWSGGEECYRVKVSCTAEEPVAYTGQGPSVSGFKIVGPAFKRGKPDYLQPGAGRHTLAFRVQVLDEPGPAVRSSAVLRSSVLLTERLSPEPVRALPDQPGYQAANHLVCLIRR